MIVVTDSLTKRYGSLAALDDCSIHVERGEIFGLLGPNGSGKTTLLRLLMGFLRPSGGRAVIDGLDCHRESVAVHERTAYLPAEARLFPRMRGREVLQFFVDVRRGGDLARSLLLAERLELDVTRRVSAYSTGMRQKLALVAVLAADTPLVILDEPTANLDPTVRAEVIALVREAKDAGRTVVFSSHVLDEVEQACDRVCILRNGRVVHQQVMTDLRRQHRIRARRHGDLAAVPTAVAEGLTIRDYDDGSVLIVTPGELSPILAWLASLPLTDVRIEPYDLRAVYDRFHGLGGGRK